MLDPLAFVFLVAVQDCCSPGPGLSRVTGHHPIPQGFSGSCPNENEDKFAMLVTVLSVLSPSLSLSLLVTNQLVQLLFLLSLKSLPSGWFPPKVKLF